MEKEKHIALLGDIHSNYLALKACLSDCKRQNIKEYILLGDYISDCPYPQRTMKQLYQLRETYKTWFIRGNREEYQLAHRRGESEYWQAGSSTGSLYYTYQNLTKADFEFFQSIPIWMEISFEGFPAFTICHGSPSSTKELLFAESPIADRYLEESKTELLICAHTHAQQEYHHFEKRLVNPGSVGIAHHAKGKAQYAVLIGKDARWEIEYHTIDYPIQTLLKEYKESPLMEMCPIFSKNIIDELQTGETCLVDLVNMAQRLADLDGCETEAFRIPEKYWEQAYITKMIEERKKAEDIDKI